MDEMKRQGLVSEDEAPTQRVAQPRVAARAINEVASDSGLRPAGPLGVGRIGAREALRQRAARLRAEADGLDALSRALPLELPEPADAALWVLVMKARG